MERTWYYANGADRRGPHTDSEMRALIAQGDVTPATLVWSEGMADWIPLSASELAPAGTTPVAPVSPAAASQTFVPPAAASAPRPLSGSLRPSTTGVPEGLRGWMQFTGIMIIIGGALNCLSCIGIIFGVPMIIAGVAFGAAAGLLDQVREVNAQTAALLLKLRSGFKALGISIIISLVASILFFFLYIAFFAAVFRKVGADMGVEL